jgi:hypothetical protein
MITTHPQPPAFAAAKLIHCIDTCFDCAQACTTCADACLAEDSVSKLIRCIRLNLDCADVCGATGRILSRLTAVDQELVRFQLEACAAACRICGQECEHHAANLEHCRACATACRDCEEACNALLAGLGA